MKYPPIVTIVYTGKDRVGGRKLTKGELLTQEPYMSLMRDSHFEDRINFVDFRRLPKINHTIKMLISHSLLYGNPW